MALTTDPFRRSLDEINRDLADTMKANEETRKNFYRSAAIGGNDAAANYHSSPAATGEVITSTDVVLREVQLAVNREMPHQEHRIKELIAREWDLRAQELDRVLRSRFSDLQQHQDATGRLLKEMVQSTNTLKADVNERLDEVETTMKTTVEQLKRQFNQTTRELKQEMTTLRDEVELLQSSYRKDQYELNRKVDSSSKKLAEDLKHDLVELDNQVHCLRTDTDCALRELQSNLTVESESIQRQMKQAMANSRAGEDAVKKMANKMVEVLQDVSVQRSTVRQMKSDLMEVELYCQGQVQKIQHGKNLGGSSSQQQQPNDNRHSQQQQLVETRQMQNDIQALKESVAYLADLVHNEGVLGGSGGENNKRTWKGKGQPQQQQQRAGGAQQQQHMNPNALMKMQHQRNKAVVGSSAVTSPVIPYNNAFGGGHDNDGNGYYASKNKHQNQPQYARASGGGGHMSPTSLKAALVATDEEDDNQDGAYAQNNTMKRANNRASAVATAGSLGVGRGTNQSNLSVVGGGGASGLPPRGSVGVSYSAIEADDDDDEFQRSRDEAGYRAVLGKDASPPDQPLMPSGQYQQGGGGGGGYGSTGSWGEDDDDDDALMNSKLTASQTNLD